MEEEEENLRAHAAAAPAAASSRRSRRSSPSSTSSASSSSSSRLPAVAEEDEEEEEEEVEETEEECNSSSSSWKTPLCVFDFDHTLIDFDSAEEVVSQLAPELAPMLTSLTMPADFIPLTNAVAAEAARRGVREAHWLAALADTGRRGLLGSGGVSAKAAAAMAKDKALAVGGGAGVLRAAAAGGAEVRILSDANDLFIAAMLQAAGLGPDAGVVSGVVTNRARFVSTSTTSTSTTPRSGSSSSAIAPSPPPSRLVVEPRHDASRLGPHGCRLCPTNLCKGLELRRLVGGRGGEGGREGDSPAAAARRRAGVALSSSSSSSSRSRRRTVIYAGDGENDLCPALKLKGGDSLLVRRGRGLERLLRERAAEEEEEVGICNAAAFLRQHAPLSRAFDASLSSALGQEGARAFVWDTAEELRALVEALLLLCEDDIAGELLLSDL